MATPVIMPRQGLSVESCLITEWKKDVGDEVVEGDILFTYETDKSAFEKEAEQDGILLGKFFEKMDEVPVLTNVCVIGEEGENIDEYAPASDEEEAEEVTEEKSENKSETEKPVEKDEKVISVKDSGEDSEDIIKISPRAEKLAEDNNLDFRHAEATGPKGRIIERDIEKLLEEGPVFTSAAGKEYSKSDIKQGVSGTGLGGRVTTADLEKAGQVQISEEPPAETGYEDVKLTNIRKVIAESMKKSLDSTAQLTFNASFDATSILNFRKQIKEKRENFGLANITLNDMILFAVSRTLSNHDQLNAHMLDNKMRLFDNIHLGIAVDTERGLMVPTVFNANLKSLDQIAKEAESRIEECKSGSINPDYLEGASFTVTNLGALGIESFTPILNPPQTGILGVDTVVQRIKEVDGEYIHYPSMGLSLTCDHRAIDGAVAARFLQELKSNLENFTLMMVK